MTAKLSDRFSQALVFAEKHHRSQMRKASTVPYISHVLAVSALVLEFGGDEDQACAALLHDVVEDCGVTLQEIEQKFGSRVAKIVSDNSDWTGQGTKPSWEERKKGFITRLQDGRVSEDSLLVIAADKLHNARTLARDLNNVGESAWKKFNASPERIRWYYKEILSALASRKTQIKPESHYILIELRETILNLTPKS